MCSLVLVFIVATLVGGTMDNKNQLSNCHLGYAEKLFLVIDLYSSERPLSLPAFTSDCSKYETQWLLAPSQLPNWAYWQLSKSVSL